MSLAARARTWGAYPSEIADSYPCDARAPLPGERLVRAVSVNAPSATVYQWVCQLTVAPYSYDLLDNRGRRSPRTLTPGADNLEVGQTFLVFTITEFEEGHHVTGVSTARATRLFGEMALTYRVDSAGADRSRLVACLSVAKDGRWLGLRQWLLMYGDWLMMRKQLLTLKKCAESASG